MKLHLFIFLLVRIWTCYGQVDGDLKQLKQVLKMNNRAVYMFCRGTKSKSSMIARKFNLMDSNSTHVGLGIITDGHLSIFNVTDQHAGYAGALLQDSLESFIKVPDLSYLAVWKCDVPERKLKKIRLLCNTYSQRNICFDGTFTISDDDKLYCSEFCANVFNRTEFPRFYFSPVTRELNDRLLEMILDRKRITYFPVDFFQSNKRFRMIFQRKEGS